MKSPLAKVSTLAQMITLSDPTLSADSRRRVDAIGSHAANLTAMVNKMLTSFAMARGDVALRRESVAIEPLLRQIIETNCSAAELSRVTLRLATPALRFDLDPGLAELAIANILANALKYSPVEAEVTIVAALEDARLVIAVADRGTGIDAEDQATFGAMFARGRAAGAVPGVGLGGYIAKMAMQAHGGDILIRNRQGGGAEVSLLFNASDATETAA